MVFHSIDVPSLFFQYPRKRQRERFQISATTNNTAIHNFSRRSTDLPTRELESFYRKLSRDEPARAWPIANPTVVAHARTTLVAFFPSQLDFFFFFFFFSLLFVEKPRPHVRATGLNEQTKSKPETRSSGKRALSLRRTRSSGSCSFAAQRSSLFPVTPLLEVKTHCPLGKRCPDHLRLPFVLAERSSFGGGQAKAGGGLKLHFPGCSAKAHTASP